MINVKKFAAFIGDDMAWKQIASFTNFAFDIACCTSFVCYRVNLKKFGNIFNLLVVVNVGHELTNILNKKRIEKPNKASNFLDQLLENGPESWRSANYKRSVVVWNRQSTSTRR